MSDEEVLALPLSQQWSHSKWNARKNAYTKVGELFEAYDEGALAEWPRQLKSAATDANVIALEAGINCCASYAKVASPADVDALRGALLEAMADKACSANKPGAKLAFQACCQEIVDGSSTPGAIIEPLLPSLQVKSPKAVAAAVANLTALYTTFGKVLPVAPVLKQLDKLFALTDRNIRAETVSLALVLCQVAGRGPVDAALANAKPALLKELDPKFAAVPPFEPKRVPRVLQQSQSQADEGGAPTEVDSMQVEELDAYALADAQRVDLPDISEPLSSSKWKERNDALESILPLLEGVTKIQPQDYSRLVNQLAKVIAKDVNVMCYGAAIKIVTLLARGLRGDFGYDQVLAPVVDRLKEKKATIIESVSECITALTVCWGHKPILEALAANLGNRIVQARLETSRVLVQLLLGLGKQPSDALKQIGQAAAKNMGDPLEAVRAESAKVLAVLLQLNGPQIKPIVAQLDDLRKKRVEDAASELGVQKKDQSQGPQKVPKSPQRAPQSPQRAPKSPQKAAAGTARPLAQPFAPAPPAALDRKKLARPLENTDFTPERQVDTRRRFSPATDQPAQPAQPAPRSPVRESPLRTGRLSPVKQAVSRADDTHFEIKYQQLKSECSVHMRECDNYKQKLMEERDAHQRSQQEIQLLQRKIQQLRTENAELKIELESRSYADISNESLDRHISQVNLGKPGGKSSGKPSDGALKPLALSLGAPRSTGTSDKREAWLKSSSENWRRAVEVTNELKKRVEDMKRARQGNPEWPFGT